MCKLLHFSGHILLHHIICHPIYFEKWWNSENCHIQTKTDNLQPLSLCLTISNQNTTIGIFLVLNLHLKTFFQSFVSEMRTLSWFFETWRGSKIQSLYSQLPPLNSKVCIGCVTSFHWLLGRRTCGDRRCTSPLQNLDIYIIQSHSPLILKDNGCIKL